MTLKDATPPADRLRVSVIGPGNLGSKLAEALLAEGADVAVWNRSPGRLTPLVEAGAVAPATLEAALEHAEVVVFALPDYDAVHELFDPAIAAGWLRGRLVVNLGTGDGDQAARARDAFVGGGAEYLDGDCGTYPSAIGSDASACIYSGPRAAFDRIEAGVVRAFGRDGAWVGEDIGAANSLFMATSGFFMTSLVSFFEGAAHARRHDISVAAYTDFAIKYLETLRDLFATSQPLMESRDHGSVGYAALSLYVSAVETIRADAEAVGARADLLGASLRYLAEGLEAGYADSEVSALYEVLLDDERQTV
jgi:3-hydroxyisobutyrate dehydrogenase-like beta-hydroxyacid dehydrogenase